MPGSTPPTPDPTHDTLILEVLREVLARHSAATSEDAAAERAADPDVAIDAEPPPATSSESGLTRDELERIADYEARANEPLEPPIHVARSLQRLLVGVLVAAAVVNVPLVHGRPLTQALPDRTALVVRDGLLLKGAGPEVYVVEDGRKRWIHSLDAFKAQAYVWDDVHTVDAKYLATFPDGRPVFELLRCVDSPHVYRIEDGRKRWIKDVPTLLAEGHRWEDVTVRPCPSIAAIPFGPPLPPDAGRPKQDLSTGDVLAPIAPFAP